MTFLCILGAGCLIRLLRKVVLSWKTHKSAYYEIFKSSLYGKHSFFSTLGICIGMRLNQSVISLSQVNIFFPSEFVVKGELCKSSFFTILLAMFFYFQ